MKFLRSSVLAVALVAGPAAAQTVSATATAATSIVQAGQHVLFGAHATPTVAGFLMLFDATSEPADGVVSPKGCFFTDPNGSKAATVGMANTPAAVPFNSGIVATFSVGADCFHKVASATYISMLWQ